MILSPSIFLTTISDCKSLDPFAEEHYAKKKKKKHNQPKKTPHIYLKINLKCVFNTILYVKRSDDSLSSMF